MGRDATHGLSLDRLPRELPVFGIEGTGLAFEAPVTPPVQAAIPEPPRARITG
ncbi:hypothetical protein GCM10009525_87530 [Streptosporangium amethystogenes subsp. fukuiense]